MATTARSLVRYLRPELPLPGLLFLGPGRGRRALGHEDWAGLAPHAHDGFELSWFRSGQVDWWSPAGLYELGPGWCFATPPAAIHGSATGRLDPCEVFWLQCDPARLGGLGRAQRLVLGDALRRLPAAFPGGDLLAPWQDLFQAVAAIPARGRRSLAILHAQACLLRLLTRLAAPTPAPAPPPALARALRRADEGPASVTALARAARCSAAELSRLFRREIGDSPGAWLRRRQISAAKRLLRGGAQEVTAVALACGFPSSQHFATRFRQATGLTPSAYRRLATAAG
jgi:AraC-like DNA-binding protein